MDETQTNTAENFEAESENAAQESGDDGNHLERALSLELPVIAVLAEKEMPLADVLTLRKDAVIAFKKLNNELLDLYINDQRIGAGKAIKVGEQFGIYLQEIGTARQMIESLS
jgi:flagellar motor switch protein FliN/FliY